MPIAINKTTQSVSEIHQVLLQATIQFDEENHIDTVHFLGRTVSQLDNHQFGEEVANHLEWDQKIVFEQLRVRGAACATSAAVTTALPLRQWRQIFGELTVERLAFDDPATRTTPGTFSRSDAYKWRAVLVSTGRPGGHYAVAVEPFGCTVTNLNRL
jgi:hypothetical protein